MQSAESSQSFAWLRSKLPALVFCFCVIQPILDIMGYWQDAWKIGNTLTLSLRMLLLAAMVISGFLLSERKRYYLAAAAGLAVFTALHALACVFSPNGYRQPMQDLINLVRIYMLPLTVLCFVTFLRQNELVLPAVKKGMTAVCFLILAVQLISAATGSDPHTYHDDGIGTLGWFLWTNSQSAILSILLPVSVLWAMNRWKDRAVPVACVTFCSELTLFLLAPRLAYACMLATGFGVGFWTLLVCARRRKQAAAILLVTALFFAAYPISPTSRRLSAVQAQSAASQQNLDKKQTVRLHKPAPGETLSGEELAQYEKIYHSLGTVYSVVERFGLERTLEAYDYSLDASVLCDARLRKITFCSLLMENAGPMARLFGLNVSEMFQFIRQGFLNEETGVWEDGYESLDAENDFYGVYFLTGAVGLCLLAALLVLIFLRVLASLRRWSDGEDMLRIGAFSASFACAVLHAIFTASVLRRNNASVFFGVVLAVLWVLTEQGRRRNQTEQISS